MPANPAVFLFLGATVVAVFAFLSIAVWVSGPSQERLARERMALLKTVAEQPGDNAAQVLAMLREEDRRKELKARQEERSGNLLGGAVCIATGVGLSVMLLVMDNRAWAVGLIPGLVGVVLVGAGLLRKRD